MAGFGDGFTSVLMHRRLTAANSRQQPNQAARLKPPAQLHISIAKNVDKYSNLLHLLL